MSELFEELLDEARRNEAIIGLVLGGSRGKGAHVAPSSDYDVYVITTDERARDEVGNRFPTRHGAPVEVFPYTLEDFRAYALPDRGEEHWYAYGLAHTTPLVDKLDGALAEIVAAKGRRDPADAAGPLDGYINFYYRSLKNARIGLARESHFEAAESVPWFLDFLFIVHGRVRPYNKWLPWELETHPLGEPWSVESLLPRLERILATGDLDTQRGLFHDAEALARAKAHGATVDGWGPDVPFLRAGLTTSS